MIETNEGEAPVFENLQVFRMADAMGRHAGVRQGVIAENIANADTPKFKARDISPFSESINTSVSTLRMRATRPGHLGESEPGPRFEAEEDKNAWSSPNGNNVSLEEQMLKSVEVQQEHAQAVAIYKSAMSMMRTSLGRR